VFKVLIKPKVSNIHSPTPEGSNVGRIWMMCDIDPGGVACDMRIRLNWKNIEFHR